MDEDRPGAKCPQCDSSRQALIVYGLVEMTPDLRASLSRGAVALGGSRIRPDNPEWLCQNCGHRWGDSSQSRYLLEWEIAREEARKAQGGARWGRFRRLFWGRGADPKAALGGNPLWDQELDA